MSGAMLIELLSSSARECSDAKASLIYSAFEEPFLVQGMTDQARFKLETKITSLLKDTHKSMTLGAVLANLYVNSISSVSENVLSWPGLLLVAATKKNDVTVGVIAPTVCKLLSIIHKTPDQLRIMGLQKIHDLIKMLISSDLGSTEFESLKFLIQYFPSQSRQYNGKLQAICTKYAAHRELWSQSAELRANLVYLDKEISQTWSQNVQETLTLLGTLSDKNEEISYPSYALSTTEIEFLNARFLYKRLSVYLQCSQNPDGNNFKRRINSNDFLKAIIQNLTCTNADIIRFTLHFLNGSYSQLSSLLCLNLETALPNIVNSCYISRNCHFQALELAGKLIDSVKWLSKDYHPLLFKLAKRSLSLYIEAGDGMTQLTDKEIDTISEFSGRLIVCCDQIEDSLRTSLDGFLLLNSTSEQGKASLLVSVQNPGKHTIAALATGVLNEELDSLVHSALPHEPRLISEFSGYNHSELVSKVHEQTEESKLEIPAAADTGDAADDGMADVAEITEGTVKVTLPKVDYSFQAISTPTPAPVSAPRDVPPEKRQKIEHKEPAAEMEESDNGSDGEGDFVMPSLSMDSD